MTSADSLSELASSATLAAHVVLLALKKPSYIQQNSIKVSSKGEECTGLEIQLWVK